MVVAVIISLQLEVTSGDNDVLVKCCSKSIVCLHDKESSAEIGYSKSSICGLAINRVLLKIIYLIVNRVIWNFASEQSCSSCSIQSIVLINKVNNIGFIHYSEIIFYFSSTDISN